MSARRSILLSFDNLGEASELERGTWPSEKPTGRHPSVTIALPRLLDHLDEQGLTATFFVEALNCELYPDAQGEIAARGHELGVHGWRHEAWAGLPPDRERDILDRATRAFASLGLAPSGFRPPGGEPTALTPKLLGERGYTWWSPAHDKDDNPGRKPAAIPFDWTLVDAYHLMERFADLRVTRGDHRAPRTPAETGERLRTQLEHGSGTQAVILHPFLMLDEDWWLESRRILATLAELKHENIATVGPGRELTGAHT